MNRMVEWFARNSVAANLLMVFLVISGLIAAFGVSSEVMPTMSLDRLQIDVPYLGAAPDEVEEAVCVRIEEAILGVDGIKQIISTASEGMGRVTVELEVSADARRVLDDIKGRVDAIDTFPEETEKPIMQELIGRHRVIDLAVSGQADELALKMAAERIRDELSALPEISQVEVTGARPYEISIEVSELALRRHGLTFDDVADAVRQSSLDLPGGSVRRAARSCSARSDRRIAGSTTRTASCSRGPMAPGFSWETPRQSSTALPKPTNRRVSIWNRRSLCRCSGPGIKARLRSLAGYTNTWSVRGRHSPRGCR